MTRVEHRPWPIPKSPWIAEQVWTALLFAHYPVPADQLRAHIPNGLTLEQFSGSAWIGIVPFLLEARPRLAPPVPGLRRFLELNVRTYVTCKGKPGVWFFSLDAANPLAVWGARTFFNLPYYRAQMSASWRDRWMVYNSTRSAPHASFAARYRPTGAPFEAVPGTLEHWLTERYCLYTLKSGRLRRLDIHHWPWQLQLAEAMIETSLTSPLGIKLPVGSDVPVLHFAKRQEMVNWLLTSAE